MRSTKDLIVELDDEATKHWFVTMAIGFEHTTIFVAASDENRLASLNSAVREGGIPVGLIAADKADHEITMMARAFPEHDASVDADGFLGALLNQVRKTL
jgi:hypothetical protein